MENTMITGLGQIMNYDFSKIKVGVILFDEVKICVHCEMIIDFMKILNDKETDIKHINSKDDILNLISLHANEEYEGFVKLENEACSKILLCLFKKAEKTVCRVCKKLSKITPEQQSMAELVVNKTMEHVCKDLDIHKCECTVKFIDGHTFGMAEEDKIIINGPLAFHVMGNPIRQLIETVAHELKHVRQYLDGELENPDFDIPYHERPWEIDANKYGKEMDRMLFAQIINEVTPSYETKDVEIKFDTEDVG